MDEGLINAAISAAIVEWTEAAQWFPEDMNRYISRHEGTFVSFGMFVRGTRVRPVATAFLDRDYHHTLDGMRGIICMNLALLRLKQKHPK